MPVSWKQLQGYKLAGKYQLDRLLNEAPDQAEYEAGDVAVMVMEAGPDAGDQLAAMRDACALQHPNLLRLIEAGPARERETDLLYLASERVDRTLESAEALPPEQRRQLERGLGFAIDYLHQKGLAYNSLGPATVAQANGQWKLADYGSMTPLTPEKAAADKAALKKLLADPRWQAAPVVAAKPVPAVPDPVPVAATATTEKPKPAISEEAAIAPAPSPAPAALPEAERPRASATRTYDFPSPVPETPRSGGLMPKVAIGAGAAAALLLAVWMFSSKPQKPEAQQPVTPVSTAQKPSPVPSTAPVPDSQAKAGKPNVTVVPKPALTPAPVQATTKTVPATVAKGGVETGKASFFSPTLTGQRTASGETVNSEDLTAAHRSHPMGSKLRVTNVKNGKSVIVRVNDRGASGRGQSLIVSPRVARELGFLSAGSATVRVEPVR